MRSRKHQLLPEARKLYSWGHPLADIAERLGVSIHTLYRWRRQDLDGGLDWNGLREDVRQRAPGVIAEVLMNRLFELALADDISPPARADAAHKYALVIKQLRELQDGPGSDGVLMMNTHSEEVD